MTDLDRLKAAIDSRYVIDREIGAGGMATVYLAHDPRHNRKVAVKVLRQELSASLGAQRFFREIEVAAQLQHPNVLPLLDSGEAEGVLYYVMPFVDGESLRARLSRHGELPVHEAVKILMEVVDALAHAHSRGVVHRDIKPDNVLMSGRHALVTDFGVAKAVTEATGRHELTSVGIALGTPQYMAPEQATADPNLDARVDIYAVGCLGYELLTGRTPFAGLNPTATLAAHVGVTPDPVSRHRPSISAGLNDVIMRCLEKRPADRWQSADDLLKQLEQHVTPSTGMAPAAVARGVPRRAPLAMAGVMAIVIAAVAVAWFVLRSPPTFTLGRQTALTSEPGVELDPAISPDGRTVIYAAGSLGRKRLYLRQAGGRALPLTSDTGPSQLRPSWSPDGTRLLYAQGQNLIVAPLGGGGRIVARSARDVVRSAAWSPDGQRIAYVLGDSILVRSVDTEAVEKLGVYSDPFSLSWSHDGNYIAFGSGNSYFAADEMTPGNLAPSEILTVDARPGISERRVSRVTDRKSLNASPAWMPDGRSLLFISDRDGARDVYAIPMRGGRPAGEAQRVTSGAHVQHVALSHDGQRLLYTVLAVRSNVWVANLKPGGVTTSSELRQLTSGNQMIETVFLSRDGKRLYFDSDRPGNEELFRMTLPDGEPEQLTSHPAMDCCVSESPDGQWIGFHSSRFGTRDVLLMPAAGGDAQRVTTDSTEERGPSWSPDGNTLAFGIDGRGIAVVKREGDDRWGRPRLVIVRRFGSLQKRAVSWTQAGNVVGQAEDGGIIMAHPDRDSTWNAYAPGPGQPVVDAVNRAPLDKVYFRTRDPNGGSRVYVLDGATPRLVARFDASRPSTRLDFTTDGRTIYVIVADDQSDIYVADLIRR